jgi:hypothetical protein
MFSNSIGISQSQLYRTPPVSGFTLWLDGFDPNSNAVKPADGSTVVTWTDKSTNKNSVGGGISPTYALTAAFGGLPSVNFSGGAGGSYFHQTISNVPNAGLTSVITYFIVAEEKTAVVNTTSFEIIPTGANNDNLNMNQMIFALESSSNTLLSSARMGAALSTVNLPAVNTGYVFASLYDGTNNTGYLNNVAGTPVSSTSTFSCNVANVGTRWLSGVPASQYTGWIGEIVVYFTNLTSAQISAVNNYLLTKWNI